MASVGAAMTKSGVYVWSIVDQFIVWGDKQMTRKMSDKSDESYADLTEMGTVKFTLHWSWPEPQQ